MTIRSRAVCSALALATLVPAVAAAQSRNPYSDLFGRAPQRTGREFTSVQVRSTAGAQMGWVLASEFTQPDTAIPEGISGGADASLTADYVRDRTQLSAHGRYSYQEYRQEPAFGAPAFDAGVRLSVRPRTRLAFQGGVNFSRSPYYQLLWLQPDFTSPLPRADQSAIMMLKNDTIEASAGITSHYTSRSSLEITGVMRQANFAATAQTDFRTVGGEIMWRRQMNRDLSLHAGYGREQLADTQTFRDARYINDRVDVGVDYGKSLSFARRTSFGFGTSTSFVRENDGPYRFRMNGQVSLDQRYARTWQMRLAAYRATEFLPGFRGPVYTDHAHAAISGYLATRLLLHLNADGGQGAAGLSDPRKFISYAGDAKLTFAMTRHLGLFTQYVYTHYQMPADPLTLFFVPRGARQAVSIGVETWLSIFDKEKVTSDTR